MNEDKEEKAYGGGEKGCENGEGVHEDEVPGELGVGSSSFDHYDLPERESFILSGGAEEAGVREIIAEYSRGRGTRDDITPSGEWIEAVTYINHTRYSRVTIVSHYSIFEFSPPNVSGPRSADEIRALVDGAGGPDAAFHRDILDCFEEKFLDFVNYTFPEVDLAYGVTNLTVDTVDQSIENRSGYWNDGDPYQPPIEYLVEADVRLNKRSFHLEEYDVRNMDDLLAGILNMGAHYLKETDVRIRAGNMVQYNISTSELPDTGVSTAMDEDSLDTSVTRTMDNRGFNSDLESTIPVEMYQFDAQSFEQDVSLQGIIDVQRFDAIQFGSSVSVRAMDIEQKLDEREEWRDHVSELENICADGVRLLYYNNIITLEDVNEQMDENIENVSELLAETFNVEEVNVSYQWDMESLAGLDPLYVVDDMRNTPAVKCDVSTDPLDANLLENGDFDNEMITGVLNSGAVVRVNFEPPEVEYTDSYLIKLPSGIIMDAAVGDIDPKGQEGGRNTYLWEANRSIEVDLMSVCESAVKARGLEQADAYAHIEIVMSDVEVRSFSSALADTDISVECEISYLGLEDIQGELGESVELKYVNSDLLRLAIHKGLINRSEIYNMSAELENTVKDNFDPEAKVDSVLRNMDWGSGDNVSYMDGSPPLEIRLDAKLKFDIMDPPDMGAESFKVFQREIELPLEGIEGLETRYRITLPRGIEFQSPRDDNGTAAVKRTSDGRSRLEVNLGADSPQKSEDMKVSIVVTIWFFLYKMCVPLVLTLILIVAALALALKKRAVKKRREKEEYRGESYGRMRGEQGQGMIDEQKPIGKPQDDHIAPEEEEMDEKNDLDW